MIKPPRLIHCLFKSARLVFFSVFGSGVVRVDVNLQDVDIDQCSTSGWFAGTHRCNLTSMEVRRRVSAHSVEGRLPTMHQKSFSHLNVRFNRTAVTKIGRLARVAVGVSICIRFSPKRL